MAVMSAMFWAEESARFSWSQEGEQVFAMLTMLQISVRDRERSREFAYRM